MADYLVDLRDVRFLIHEYLDVEKLLTYPKFAEFNTEMFDMILEEGVKQAKEIAAPLAASAKASSPAGPTVKSRTAVKYPSETARSSTHTSSNHTHEPPSER